MVLFISFGYVVFPMMLLRLCKYDVFSLQILSTVFFMLLIHLVM